MDTYPETKYIDKSNKMIESIDQEITTFAKNATVQDLVANEASKAFRKKKSSDFWRWNGVFLPKVY